MYLYAARTKAIGARYKACFNAFWVPFILAYLYLAFALTGFAYLYFGNRKALLAK